MTEEKNKPTRVFKQGVVSISVWEKEGMPTKYSVQKSYKKDDEWKFTNNLDLADLYIVQKLIGVITSKSIMVYEDDA